MDLISIIVPVYNVDKYLNRCIDSIIAQSYKKIEIILVDDGSSDKSGNICDEYLKRDSRIKVIHKKNGGLSDARNVGLSIASGTYYAFIDSDDYITNDMIESLYRAAILNNCQIAVCNMKRFWENGKIDTFYEPVDHEMVYDGLDRFESLKQPSVCNKLFYAKLFEGIYFPKGKYYEDTYIYHEVLYKAKKIVLTGKIGYWYLARENSILGEPRYTKRYFDFIEAVSFRMKFLLKHNVSPYDIEACLSMYIAFSNAVKYIKKTNDVELKFENAEEAFELAYKKLMNCKNIGKKQKLRLFILKRFPKIHSKLY